MFLFREIEHKTRKIPFHNMELKPKFYLPIGDLKFGLYCKPMFLGPVKE